MLIDDDDEAFADINPRRSKKTATRTHASSKPTIFAYLHSNTKPDIVRIDRLNTQKVDLLTPLWATREKMKEPR